MIKNLNLFTALILAALPLQIDAQLYRCDVDGRIVYSDQRCGTGYVEIIRARPVSGRDAEEVDESTAVNPDDDAQLADSQRRSGDNTRCQDFRNKLRQYESQKTFSSDELRQRTEEQRAFYRGMVAKTCG